jgi:hypothetical protein
MFAFVMKHAFEKNATKILKDIIEDLSIIAKKCGEEYIYAILSYILETFELPKEEFTKTIKQLNQIYNLLMR